MHAVSSAIVRPPGPTFAQGLTTSSLGPPDLKAALEQHAAYRDALRRCGVDVVELIPSVDDPDATFVEDVAVIAGDRVMLTRPGAPSRRREVDLIRESIAARFDKVAEIAEPGTLDGGDVCDAGDRWYIGLSDRTNEAGAEQLSRWLAKAKLAATVVDVRPTGLLHLKSGVAFVGDRTFVISPTLAIHRAFQRRKLVVVDDDEVYAANCIRVNDQVLVPSGNPKTAADLRDAGFDIVELSMSEFEKMDGGLSCLSLRF